MHVFNNNVVLARAIGYLTVSGFVTFSEKVCVIK